MTAENDEGMSKPVYRAETPQGGEWVKLDGFAVMGSVQFNGSVTERRAPNKPVRVKAHPSSDSVSVQWRPPHSSGPQQPGRVRSYLLGLAQNDRRMDYTPLQADQRSHEKRKLASESVYVVSLQAQNALGQSSPVYRAVMTKKKTAEPEEVHDAKDITVRVVSPQSVLVTWVDPAVEKEKTVSDSRYYTVRYREKGESARWDYRETTQRRLLVDSLSADNMYEFSIRISQGERNSKWSVSVFQRTPESAPSGPPENFLVKPLRGKGTAVTATWEPPEETNGRIRASTVASTPSQHSRNQDSRRTSHGSSRTTRPDTTDSTDSDLQSVEETEEPTQYTPTTVSPTTRRSRPLSQTRSYHSIFSSVRSSVRGGGSATTQRTGGTSLSPQAKEKESKEDKDRESPKEITKASESFDEYEEEDVDEDNEEKQQLTTQNNVVHAKAVEDKTHSRTNRKDATDSSSVVKPASSAPESPAAPLKPSSGSLPKAPTSRRITPGLRPRTSSDSETSKPRRPISHSSVSPTQGSDTSSASSNSQESAAIRKDHTARTYPEGKESYDLDGTEVKPSTPAPQESLPDPHAKPSSQFPGRGSASVPTSRHTAAGAVNGRRKIPARGKLSRVHNGQRKPGSSSATSQSTLPTGAQSPQSGSHSSSSPHTENDEDYKAEEMETRDERPSSSSQTTNSHSPSLHVPSEDTHTNEDEKVISSQDTSFDTLPSSRTNLGTSGHGATPSLQNRNQRFGSGNRVRQGTRVPSSRDSSSPSIGARPPILKPVPHSDVSMTQETKEKAETPSTSFPSKNDATSGSLKPSGSGSTNPMTSSPVSSPSSPEDTHPSDPILKSPGSKDRDSDYDYHGSKDIYGKHEKITVTVPPKAATSTVGKPHSPDSSDNDSIERDSTPDKLGSSSVPSLPRRPIVGPNGRFRYPQLTNRQTGSRFPGRLLPSQHTRVGSSDPNSASSSLPSSSSSSSSSSSQPASSTDRGTTVNGGSSRVSSSLYPRSSSRHTPSERAQTSSSSQPSSTASREPVQGTRTRYPSRADVAFRGKTPSSVSKPTYEQGKNGRPNLTATNGKGVSTSNGNTKPTGRKYINGPEGMKWIVDLDKGVLMNEDGKVLQDSQGRPRRVVLGEDGRTIFDDQGSPLVNPEGLALFGHGRDSRPVVNPKDKIFTLGGKPIVGLDRPTPRTTTTTTTTVPTTTPEPTTIPTTTEMTTEEPTTAPILPTCPPGTYSRMDSQGYPVLDEDGILNCYPEEGSAGMEMDSMVSLTMAPDRADAFAIEEEHFVIQTTLPPTTEAPTTEEPTTEVPTTEAPTTTETPVPEPVMKPLNSTPTSLFDAAGKKRFTAPYVNYIRKDPGAPCSLTEALEYLQVDVLENLLEKDSHGINQPPKNKPHNITVVAMEGCHSFVILDWARPLKGDMVSGYMVHSASYDDVLNNRWSSSTATGTHLPVENLKPNSRYYFKVQAKNIFGLGPISETFTYVTESDDPLLIERPPGGEPIWIPFTFKYNPTHSTCKGSQFVKRTWYRKFVGVVLCNSLRYKIFIGDGLRETFYSIGDAFGYGEDHCQFVDSYMEGRTGPHNLSEYLPTAQGFFRSYRQEPVRFGPIGRRTAHPFVGWYECGIPIPGKW
ncbi:fibronectin type III domain-containing protein 1 isoform X1 [Megalops cyprinoides]|uniref:fibronectin type III domain-containing protein 1 isoform X1 n=1 Tax=Megalops cyprinoides TaxID=118141 RepID=UPI001864696D|nr:fibronectin type III domain-containing protein 1 isoform X1 [Megalops cyprinoides]